MSRRIVIPGELIVEGERKIGDCVFREGNKVYSSVLGMLEDKGDVVRVIPLTGKYMPKVGDFVIARIEGTQFSGWDADINSAYFTSLNARDYVHRIDPGADLGKILAPGDFIFAIVREITPRKKIYITMADGRARVLRGGRFLTITPTKVPRVVGKNSSMIAMIKNATKCDVLVGQNGRIWVDGNAAMVNLVAKVIDMIEKEAHTSGLTERIKNMILKESEKL